MDPEEEYAVDPTYPFDLKYGDEVVLDGERAKVLSVEYDEEEESYIVRYETKRFLDEEHFEDTDMIGRVVYSAS